MEKLNKILCEVFRLKDAELKDELTMEDIQSWDSLTHMNLITSIENSLPVLFSMEEIMAMTDVKTLRGIVKEKLS
jgi:acyl carrier protein